MKTSLIQSLLFVGLSIGALATAQTKPTSAAQCRVLLNLEGGDVADVRFGAKSSVERAPGFVLQEGNKLYSIDVVSRQKTNKNKYGSLVREWDKLIATPLPKGKPTVWLDGDPGLTLPESDEVMGSFDASQSFSILGNVGSSLMISSSEGGYTGGAHGYDSLSYRALRFPSKEDQGMSFLGQDALKALQDVISEEDKRRKEEESEDGLGMDPPTELKDVALSFGVSGGVLSMTLHHNLFCCTWVENHNQIDFAAPLAGVPSGLKDQLSDDKAPLFLAPDGCGALGLSSGEVVSRVREESPQTIKELSGAVIIGVTWVSPENTFSVKQLAATHKASRALAAH